jgi:hypothetical protein
MVNAKRDSLNASPVDGNSVKLEVHPTGIPNSPSN